MTEEEYRELFRWRMEDSVSPFRTQTEANAFARDVHRAASTPHRATDANAFAQQIAGQRRQYGPEQLANHVRTQEECAEYCRGLAGVRIQPLPTDIVTEGEEVP